MTTSEIKAGYVITDRGDVLVQIPASNQWGFSLCDECESWPGGIGVAKSWDLIPSDDPRITDEVREQMQWVLDENI